MANVVAPNGSMSDFLAGILLVMGYGPHTATAIMRVAEERWPFRKNINPQLVIHRLRGSPDVRTTRVKERRRTRVYFQHREVAP